jgi:3-phenylpropionate/trans-cinnamate dioxygenase ferredoxin subunit
MMKDDSGFVAVARVSDLPTGQVKVVAVNGRRYALCNAEGQFYAVDDTCSHDDGPLGEGALEGHVIVCPRHGARFDVRTGAVLQMPAVFPIQAYETKVVDGQIMIKAATDAHSRTR